MSYNHLNDCLDRLMSRLELLTQAFAGFTKKSITLLVLAPGNAKSLVMPRPDDSPRMRSLLAVASSQ